MASTRSSLCLLLSGFVLGACTCTPPAEPEAGDGCIPCQTKVQRGEVSSIRFEDFFLNHQSGEMLLIDSRDLWFYNQGHIPGAISLPTGDAMEAKIESLHGTFAQARDLEQPIIVYCNGFGCHDARTVSRAIAKAGFDVTIFGGGWKAWKKCELPVESASKADADLPPQPAS